MAETVDFFRSPLHPYTQMLLSSIPSDYQEEEELKPKVISTGEIPSPVDILRAAASTRAARSPWTSASVWTRSWSETLPVTRSAAISITSTSQQLKHLQGIGSIGITTADDGRQTTDKGRTISILT